MMPATLFFDIDSTLIENRFSRRVVAEVLQPVHEATGIPYEMLGREMGQENERRCAEDPDNVLTMDWDDIMATVARRYGITELQRGTELWERYAHPESITVLDDAGAVLAQLKAQGYRLVIATKGLLKYQRPVLTATGLWDYFDDILTPDLTGYLKTSPAYFQRYQGQAGPFIQVGDHYYDDIICAKRNGFKAVLRAPIAALDALAPTERPAHLAQHGAQIPTYPVLGSEVLPDAIVMSLQELPALLPQLL